MKTSTYILLGLLVAMMAIVYFIKKPTSEEKATFTLPDVKTLIDPSSITKIEIEKNKTFVRIEHLRDGWRMTAPVLYEINESAIRSLLDGLKNLKLTTLISTNPRKKQTYGVDEQGALITLIHADGQKSSIVIGLKDSITEQTYVCFPPYDSVFLAVGIEPSLFVKELRDWRKRTIFTSDPQTIQMISLQKGKDFTSIKKKGLNWISEGKVIPEKIMNPVLQTLSHVEADDFVDSTLIITAPPQLKIELQEAQNIRMEIFKADAIPVKYYLKTSLTPQIFVIDQSIQQQFMQLADYLFVPPVAETPLPKPPLETKEIKPSTPPVTTPPTKRPEPPKPKPVYTPKLEDEGELIIYTVKQGETLESISKKFNITVDDIKKWNQLRTNVVKPGMDLYIFTLKR